MTLNNSNGAKSLSVVVPIHASQSNFDNLRSWLFSMESESLEVIVVVDRSSDFENDNLDQLLIEIEKYRFTIHSGNYGSPGKARNAGIPLTTGEWVAFWDSDDLPLVSEFFEMTNSRVSASTEICIGEFVWYDLRTQTSHTNQKFESWGNHQIEGVAMNPGIWRMAFRRKLLADMIFCEYRMGEDQLFVAKIMSKNPIVFYCNQNVYKYYIGNPLQLTNNASAIRDLGSALTDLLEVYKKSEFEGRRFSGVAYWKMLLTYSRRSSLQKSLVAFSKTIGVILVLDSGSRRTFLQSLSFVLTNRKKS